METEPVDVQLTKRRQALDFQEQLLLKHIKREHHGEPVEACHTCGTYIQNVIANKEIVAYLLSQLDSPPQQ